MSLIETTQSVRRGQRRILRLQRRLWFAQLALWPTAILSATAVLLVAGWAIWRRSTARGPSSRPAASTAPADQA